MIEEFTNGNMWGDFYFISLFFFFKNSSNAILKKYGLRLRFKCASTTILTI